jgi:hypothetical protein
VALITGVIGVLGIVGTVLGFFGKFTVELGIVISITVFGFTVAIGPVLAAALVAFVVGVAVALALILIIGYFRADRCNDAPGSAECIAGVVSTIVPSFQSAMDWLLPFTAMHDRVDVTLKSGTTDIPGRYWDVAETGGAYVYCSSDEFPRKSEILRTYFKSSKVCNGADGALLGAVIGAAIGVALAVVVAAAVAAALIFGGGCALLGLESFGVACIVLAIVAAVIIAIAVVAACVIIGAAIVGIIAVEMTRDTAPADAHGAHIIVSDFITVHGNMLRRDHDNTANVFWWVTIDPEEKAPALSGRADGIPSNPFSHCEVDEQFALDACPTG